MSDIDNHSHLANLLGVDLEHPVPMIVCVCNRLNEAKIHRAIACGAASPEQVYALNGVARNCGTCHETIEAMLQDAQEAQGQLQAAE